MARTLHFINTNSVPTAGQNLFLPAGWGSRSASGTEARLHGKWSEVGILSHLSCYVMTYTANAAYTIRPYIGSSNGNMSLSINGTGLFEDTSNTDSYSSTNDYIKFRFSLPAGATGSMTMRGVAYQFEANSGNMVRHHPTSDSWGMSDGSNRYFWIGFGHEGGNGSATAANAQALLRANCTAGRIQVNVRSNNRTSTSTFALNVNGNESADLSISIASNATGWMEDSSGANTSNLSSNDLICLSLSHAAGSGNLTTFTNGIAFYNPAGNTVPAICRGPQANISYSGTNYFCPVLEQGGATQYGTNESDWRIRWYDGGVISDPSINVLVYSLAGTGNQGILTLMVDGNASNLVVTFTGTGQANATGSVNVAAGSDISWRLTFANCTSGTAQIGPISFLTAAAAAAAAANIPEFMFHRRQLGA